MYTLQQLCRETQTLHQILHSLLFVPLQKIIGHMQLKLKEWDSQYFSIFSQAQTPMSPLDIGGIHLKLFPFPHGTICKPIIFIESGRKKSAKEIPSPINPFLAISIVNCLVIFSSSFSCIKISTSSCYCMISKGSQQPTQYKAIASTFENVRFKKKRPKLSNS